MYTHVSGDISPSGVHSRATGHTPHGVFVSALLTGMLGLRILNVGVPRASGFAGSKLGDCSTSPSYTMMSSSD
eukprot:CAMPEP_0174889058 /NCGR_PEP_ID=MMETSP0167-20121228/4327_1 /TAXON_ID=38298 /ORGANISM="Rhodella maculata, Strain CCMP736" /LENGTH=72 /DNA_ID=CAMNT_0016126317 /DNA_START=277 /DNA_END=495 /DNA_ORIENTATION=-